MRFVIPIYPKELHSNIHSIIQGRIRHQVVGTYVCVNNIPSLITDVGTVNDITMMATSKETGAMTVSVNIEIVQYTPSIADVINMTIIDTTENGILGKAPHCEIMVPRMFLQEYIFNERLHQYEKGDESYYADDKVDVVIRNLMFKDKKFHILASLKPADSS